METIEGMHEAFREAKQVFLTTTSKEGVSKTRAMTNYNDSPYESMWYPSFKDTQKIKDIADNPEVVISFPGNERDKWYRVKGTARARTGLMRTRAVTHRSASLDVTLVSKRLIDKILEYLVSRLCSKTELS